MSGAVTVSAADDGIRLDRWFKRHYPNLAHGRLEKLLRTGQVRLDGGRVKAAQRIAQGQAIRVPPAVLAEAPAPRLPAPIAPEDAEALRASVLYRDAAVIAINKPPGLAVQGGTRTRRHLDAMLDALRFDARERPRLVHRLDKDTSGVLLLARDGAAAAHLAKAFRARAARKLYWALVAGVPRPSAGRIDLALEKAGAGGSEKVVSGKQGRRALTFYETVEEAGGRAAWLILEPRTGRTHQLRVHCAELGTPIVGDGKYGGRAAFAETGTGIAARLHLHARAIRIDHPGGGLLEVAAPLPDHMVESWRFLGFGDDEEDDPFARFDP